MEMEDRGTMVTRRGKNFEQVGVCYMRLGRMRARMMITCTCTILRYAITLEFQSLCEYFILSPPSKLLVCQLLSSSAPEGFLTNKLPSNLVLYLNTSLDGLASYADAGWMKT